MERYRSLIGLGLLLCGCIGLSSCAQLDQFSGRATEFNSQVADVQNQTLLINVMRAAHRFPMHFTEFSTVSGTQTVQATAGLTLPFSSFNKGMGVRSGSPSATVSQSPSFNLAVLETQEFYRGMLAPLTHEQILTYINEGISAEIVYSLMFGSIIYRDTPEGNPLSLDNNFHRIKKRRPEDPIPSAPAFETVCPDAGSGYACFKTVLRALIARHLKIEPTKTSVNLGPALAEAFLHDPKHFKELESQNLELASFRKDDCVQKSDVCPEGMDGLSAENRQALNKGDLLYHVRKNNAGYRFCFDEPPGIKPDPSTIAATGLARDILTSTIDAKSACRSRIPKAVAKSAVEEEQDQKGVVMLGAISLQVQPRSTEGVIYYLGEIARCNVALDSSSGSQCGVLPTIRAPYRDDTDKEDTLFAVRRGGSGIHSDAAREIAIDWYGTQYAVDVDPSGQDRSGQVFRILTQLLALNRSAKDFPAPTIVPLITR